MTRPVAASAPSGTTAVVVGAGIVGRCCALELQRRGWQVRLLDDDPDHQAPSWGNAGHIAVEQIEPLASPASLRSAWRRSTLRGGPLALRQPWRLLPWLTRFIRACHREQHRAGTAALAALMAEALPAWQRLAAELGEVVEAPPRRHPSRRQRPDDDVGKIGGTTIRAEARASLVRFGGHLVCWPDAEAARQGWQALSASLPSWITPTPIADELRQRLVTALPCTPIHGTHLHGSAGIDDHARLREAIDAAFAEAGGLCVAGHATAIRRDQATASAHILLADGSTLQADAIVVCTGVDAGDLLEPLGERVPLVAERGYHLHWTGHDWPSDLPPVVFEDRSVVVTGFRGGLRMTSFVEFAPRHAPPVPSRWKTLARHARELGLPVRGEPGRWFGARPTLPDYLPAIGRSTRAGNLFYAFGHQHLGLTLAPVTAERVADLVGGDQADIDLAAFTLARFG